MECADSNLLLFSHNFYRQLAEIGWLFKAFGVVRNMLMADALLQAMVKATDRAAVMDGLSRNKQTKKVQEGQRKVEKRLRKEIADAFAQREALRCGFLGLPRLPLHPRDTEDN